MPSPDDRSKVSHAMVDLGLSMNPRWSAARKAAMERPMKLGLIGNAGAGKDTFADRLVELGYRKVECKGPLHELLMVASLPYREAVERMGYEAAKRDTDWLRPLMLDTGKKMKELFGSDIFAQGAARASRGLDNVVVSDVRFAVEAQLLHAEGFRFVEIARPEADSGDANEALWYLKFSGVHLPRVENCGTIAELRSQADLFKPWRDY